VLALVWIFSLASLGSFPRIVFPLSICFFPSTKGILSAQFLVCVPFSPGQELVRPRFDFSKCFSSFLLSSCVKLSALPVASVPSTGSVLPKFPKDFSPPRLRFGLGFSCCLSAESVFCWGSCLGRRSSSARPVHLIPREGLHLVQRFGLYRSCRFSTPSSRTVPPADYHPPPGCIFPVRSSGSSPASSVVPFRVTQRRAPSWFRPRSVVTVLARDFIVSPLASVVAVKVSLFAWGSSTHILCCLLVYHADVLLMIFPSQPVSTLGFSRFMLPPMLD
jgi:hypothetical protein